MGRRVILYEDLNCPFCFALTEALANEGLAAAIEWRGIEHAPHAPIPVAPAGPVLAQTIAAEVSTVRERAPGCEIRLPDGQPNTAFGLRAVASLMAEDEDLGRRVRDAIKRAYWQEGADISSREVLEGILAANGAGPLQLGPEIELRVSRWAAAWNELEPRMIPALVAPGGVCRPGLGRIDEAVEFVRSHAP